MAVDGVRARAERNGVVAVDERVVGVGGRSEAARVAIHANVVEQRPVGIAPADLAEGQPVLVGAGAGAAEEIEVVGGDVGGRYDLLGSGRGQIDLRAAPIHLELGVARGDPPNVEGKAVALSIDQPVDHLRDRDVGVGLVAFEIDAVFSVGRTAPRAAGLEQFEMGAREQRPAVDRLVVAVAVGVEGRIEDGLEAAIADEVAVGTVDDVVATRVLDRIGAEATTDHVVPGIAEDLIVSRPAFEDARGLVTAVEFVVLGAADEILDRDQNVPGRVAAVRREVPGRGGLEAGTTEIDDDAVARTRVARGVVAELSVDRVGTGTAFEDVVGIVAGEGVAPLSADRVFDHDLVGDGEPTRDARDVRHVAARIRSGEGRGAQIDRGRRGDARIADRVVPAAVPDAGPAGAIGVGARQRIGIAAGTGRPVDAVELLYRGDVERHETHGVAHPVRRLLCGRGVRTRRPAADVGHDREDGLVLVIVAAVVEGIAARDAGEQLGPIMRMVEPHRMTEFVHDGGEAHPARLQITPGRIRRVVTAVRNVVARSQSDRIMIRKRRTGRRRVVPSCPGRLVFVDVRSSGR